MIAMKKSLFFYLVLFGSFALLNSCNDDDETFVSPSITAPASDMVISSETIELDFSFTAAGGFKSSSVQATNGTATVSTDGTVGSTSGTIKVSFTGGATDGAASVVLTVTDNENQTSQATAVLTVNEEDTQINVSANITANTTWETGKVYILTTRIAVVSGMTLTIQPGVIVKGQAGTGSNSTALVVARGGKLMAEGTATAPIIFTSVADEIMPENIVAGEFGSPNLAPTVNGLWGGVIVLGKAHISASGDISEVQIEGIPTSDSNGLYGGSDDADNSGVLKFISIRHGGTEIGSGNEINGLTLGGVGSGTLIENIEVIANQDDGIEWFGGTVNVKNVVTWNVGDDGIDTDQSWSGTLDNFMVITPAGHCFELDGPEGTMAAGHTIQNGTIVASLETRISEDLINVDANSMVALKNLYFTGIAATQMINRVTAAGVTFEGIQLGIDQANLASHVNGVVPAGVTAVSTPTVGADASLFSWTWASKAGALTGL